MQALLHSDLSFEKIVEVVQPPRDPSRTPLFQISFRGRAPYARLPLNDIASGPTEFLDNGTAKFDLAFELECSTGKSCFIEYCADLFKEETIVAMKDDFQELLGELVRHPDCPRQRTRDSKQDFRTLQRSASELILLTTQPSPLEPLSFCPTVFGGA
jgi:non-ribosomal peptide synthetase component F